MDILYRKYDREKGQQKHDVLSASLGESVSKLGVPEA